MGSPRSLRGLDWLNFFVANAQTGFGAFIAAYLTTQAWTQAQIGDVLSLGTAAAMLSQIPGGIIVDRLPDKRLAAAIAGVAIVVSAILFAADPTLFAVGVAEVLHSLASSLFGPALAAISLALVGLPGLGERLGRNARFASLGNGIAAAVLGACGAWLSGRSVFWLTASLMLPGLWALRAISPTNAAAIPPTNAPAIPPTNSAAIPPTNSAAIPPTNAAAIPPTNAAAIPPTNAADTEATAETPHHPTTPISRDVGLLLTDPRVLAFAGCVVLFHLSNAAMLPLVGGALAHVTGNRVDLLIAACIVLPQVFVSLISPWTGRTADRTGPRLVLVLGFAALPVRGVLLAVAINNPGLLVAVQTLDGLSAAVFGVMLPLVAAELTWGTERFNLCIGVLGLAAAAGATSSTLLAGMIADAFGVRVALMALAGCGMLAVLAVLAAPGPDVAKAGPLSARGS